MYKFQKLKYIHKIYINLFTETWPLYTLVTDYSEFPIGINRFKENSKKFRFYALANEKFTNSIWMSYLINNNFIRKLLRHE